MPDFTTLSDKELVQAARERSERILELTDRFEKLQKKLREIREEGQLVETECEKAHRQYKQILKEAKTRGIKTT